MTDARPIYFGTLRASAGGASVTADLGKLIVSRLLIQANSGGGKSRAIRYLLEQTNGQIQHIVIDREGEFATLREKFPYLLAGAGGDVAADLRSSKLLARKVMELGLSVIIDLSEMSLAMQKDYVRSFIEAINHLPRALWHDCLIIIDEAHLFAPESGKGHSAATEEIAQAAATWRKRGYCLVLATQRLAKLNKDVAAECLNKLIGRTSNEDLRRAGEELNLSAVVARQLRELDPGTFWAYGPAIAGEPVLVRTGKVSTSPPERGAARGHTPAAPDAIKKVLAELADLPKQADEEAQTLEGLQRQNAELRREVRALQVGAPPREVEVRVVDHAAVAAAVEAERKGWEAHRRQAVELIEKATEWLTTDPQRAAPVEYVPRAGAPPSPVPRALAKIETVAGVDRPRPTRVVLSQPDGLRTIPSDNGEVPSGARRMLEALARRYPDKPTRSQLGKLARFAPGGGTFGNYLRLLKAREFVIEEANGQLSITDRGFGYSGVPKMARLKTPEEAYAIWSTVLNTGERKMLDVVRHAHPMPLTREVLGAQSGFAVGGGTFGNYFRTLKRNGLVEERDNYVALGAELRGA